MARDVKITLMGAASGVFAASAVRDLRVTKGLTASRDTDGRERTPIGTICPMRGIQPA